MKKGLFNFNALAAVAFRSFPSAAQTWLTAKAGGGLALASGYAGSVGRIISYRRYRLQYTMSKRLMIEGDILMDTRALLYPTYLCGRR